LAFEVYGVSDVVGQMCGGEDVVWASAGQVKVVSALLG